MSPYYAFVLAVLTVLLTALVVAIVVELYGRTLYCAWCHRSYAFWRVDSDRCCRTCRSQFRQQIHRVIHEAPPRFRDVISSGRRLNNP